MKTSSVISAEHDTTDIEMDAWMRMDKFALYRKCDHDTMDIEMDACMLSTKKKKKDDINKVVMKSANKNSVPVKNLKLINFANSSFIT
jgi:hypothetical protein